MPIFTAILYSNTTAIDPAIIFSVYFSNATTIVIPLNKTNFTAYESSDNYCPHH